MGSFIFLSGSLKSQNFSFNCAKDTLVPGCPTNLCITLKALIPDLHGLSTSYSLNPGSSIPGCFPVYAQPDDPAGTPSNLTIDDRYSSVINIGFPFPFYGTVYNDLVASTNGYLSFDISLAGGFSHWQNRGDLPNTQYDRALIMGPYHDLYPGQPTSPNQRIQYQVFGTAPHRRWILSFYKVPLFQCTSLIENTHQIILYESTGIIEVKIFDKQICSTWNGGKAMVGIQDFTRTLGMTAPARKMSDPPWGSIGMNETWRFVPDAGPSLFKRVELYDMSNNLLITGTVAPYGSGQLEASFPNLCAPAGATTSYIVKSVYEKIDDPAVEIFGMDTVRVNRANPLTANVAPTAASCGTNNGTLTVTGVSGGTPPYQYSLNGTTWQASNIFTGLAAGTYTVWVRDAPNVCSVTLPPVTINSAGNINATTNATATSCPGVNNGSITITSAGGTGPYTFSLDGAPAVPGTIPFTFSNLTPVNHTITVYDAGTSCNTGPLSVTVASGPGINNSWTATQTACVGISNGTITVTASNGTAPYTWSLDGGALVAGPNPNTFTNLSAGSHNVVISDVNGCTTPPIPITVTTGPGVNGNATASATSCPTVNNGSITVTATSGTAPFTFSLDGGPPQSGGSPYTFINVSAGSHNVLITDNFGCTFPVNNITVNAGPPLSGNAVMASTNCNGATDGSITITPLGGTAPFTFSLDGGAPQSGGAPYTFINVPSGPHSVVIADAIGCISNPIPANVSAGPQLITTASSTPALCNGSATGSITVAVPTIGTAPYQYSLDNVTWQASNVFNGLAANTYTVYYSSANGCQGTPLSVIVSAPSSVSASVSTTAVTCNGLSDGIITINASGGMPPYQYSINGGTTWQSSNVFNVPANTYNILIQDANNCTLPQTAIVTEPAPLAVGLSTTNATCNGGSNGSITVNVSGGNPGYQYSLDAVNFQSSNIFNVTANTYTITVKDNLGCIASSGITVALTNDLTFTPQIDATICEGSSTQLNLTSNAIQYSWTPATGLSSTTIPNPVANPTVTTTYTVTATLGVCTATDDVIVNVNAAPVPDAGPDGNICYGQSYTLQGSGGVQYTWTPSTYLSSTTIANPVSTPSRTITYTLSEVIDAIGCKSLVTDQVTVDVTPPIKVRTFPFDTVVYAGDQFQLNATSIANMYTWSPATGLSNPNIANPVVTAGPVGTDVVYQVTAFTAAGCKGEGYVRVKVYTGPDIYMPTAFTPNGDGKNDRFTPFPVGVVSIKYFRVFDRWGQLVFSTNKLYDGWDGKLGGIEAPTGVYVWTVEGVTKNNKVITKKGTVSLIR